MSIIIYHPDGIDDVYLGAALQVFYKQKFLIIGWDFFRPVPLNSLVCAALPHGPDGHIGQEQGYIERIIHLDEAMREFNLSQPAFRYYENRLSHWVAEQRAPFSVDDALSALGTGMDIHTDTAHFAIPSIRNALTNLGCTKTVTVVYTPPQHGTANKTPPAPPPARNVTGDIYS